MKSVRLLAVLAISVSCAHPAARAEQPSSAPRRAVGAVADAASMEAAPQTDLAHTNPASCPYRFDSNMPSDTFCVYQGVAFDRSGEVCASDVVVIWSSLASQASVNRALTENESGSNAEVDLGFVTDPELVVRAIVDPRQSDRAELAWYTRGGEETPQAVAGQMNLRASADVLSMDVREPGRFHIGRCALASYAGTFVGMMQPPSEMTNAADRFLALDRRKEEPHR